MNNGPPKIPSLKYLELVNVTLYGKRDLTKSFFAKDSDYDCDFCLVMERLPRWSLGVMLGVFI